MGVAWIAVATDVAVGGGAGALDQVVQNQDEKRRRDAEAAGTPLTVWKQFGTYYNYGVPVLAILGVAFNFLKGEWATRAVVTGSQLAGRKVVHTMTKATQATPWRQYIPPSGGGPAVPQTPKPGFEMVGIV